MSSDGDSPFSVEEVEKALIEIENKYSPVVKNPKRNDCFEETLGVLSKEFDSLGLPAIDQSQPISKIFKQVVSGARALVQIYRRTLARMKDVNIDIRYKESKSTELYKIIGEYKLKIAKCDEKNSALQNKIIKLTNDHRESLKKESMLKEELEKTKRYYLSKQNEFHHHIKKLTKENHHLREILGKDINIHRTKDEVTLKLMRKYKGNEEIYKSTIQKLQENNMDLLNDVLDLKEDFICNNKQNCS